MSMTPLELKCKLNAEFYFPYLNSGTSW